MPANRALTYVSKSEDSQVMEVMGQSMDTQSTSSSTFTFKSKGLKDKNLLLGVTVDQVNVKAKTAERMGPVGEGRAIETRAVCLLVRG